MNETIRQIIDIEWEMFHNVNGEERCDCQDQRPTFEAMRNAQFEVWSEEARLSYLEDVKRAVAEDRSVVKEKYIRMMECSDPEGYEHFKDLLPELSEEQKATTEEIWKHMLAQTEKMREKYPVLALGGRPLHASEEQGWPSIETYQKSELLTYSAKTLKLLLDRINELEAQGIDMAYKIQENSVLCLGYKNMDEAELAMAAQFMQEMGIEISEGCPTCSTNINE